MQIILDHLSAQIITAGLLLSLVAITASGQRSMYEANSFYALRKQQINFVSFLKRDLQNVTQVESVTEDPYTLTFTFYARTDSADAAPRQVTYRRVAVPSGETTFYQIERLVDGQPAGGSMSTLTYWDIRALNAEGDSVSTAANARMLLVEFEAENPYSNAEEPERARWKAEFRPPLIQQTENL